MRILEIASLPASSSRVRRIASANRPEGAMVAVFVGDENATHSIHWLRLRDGQELLRRSLPVFPGVPDPVLSSELSLLAFVEPGEVLRVVVEMPHQPQHGQRYARILPCEEDDMPRECRSLGISHHARKLRVSLCDGELNTFEIGETFAGPPSDDERAFLRHNGSIVETVLPARAIAHGSSATFDRAIGRRGPTDIYILAGEARGANFVVDGHEPQVLDLGSRVQPRTAAFSPDGSRFGIAVENHVLLWQIVGWTPQMRSVLTGHDGPVTALAFSPNNAIIATASEEGSARFWDADTGALRSSKDCEIGRLGGIEFSPDGLDCIVGGEDGRLVVWSLDEEGESLPSGPPHPNEDRIDTPYDDVFDDEAFEEYAPAVDPGPEGQCWVRVEGMCIPLNAVVAGHEAEGTPLYAVRANHRDGVYLGKVRHGFAGANIGYRKREIAVVPFEVLVGTADWASAENGEIPAEAIACGHDDKGVSFFLARAALGEGLHPGRIARGMTAARIPFGGVEIEVGQYEVMVRTTRQSVPDLQGSRPSDRATLLFWDFENAMSERGISISVGISSSPKAINGFISQTGGGPVEAWGETGTVFLTRHLGTNDMYLWLTLTERIILEAFTFRHWHNHNPGYPTAPSYQAQLQIDSGDGYVDVGPSLILSNETSGRTDTIQVGRLLEPGSYKFRWRPRGLHRSRDTSSEFFAVKDLRLEGRFIEE